MSWCKMIVARCQTIVILSATKELRGANYLAAWPKPIWTTCSRTICTVHDEKRLEPLLTERAASTRTIWILHVWDMFIPQRQIWIFSFYLEECLAAFYERTGTNFLFPSSTETSQMPGAFGQAKIVGNATIETVCPSILNPWAIGGQAECSLCMVWNLST